MCAGSYLVNSRHWQLVTANKIISTHSKTGSKNSELMVDFILVKKSLFLTVEKCIDVFPKSILSKNEDIESLLILYFGSYDAP